MIRLLVSLAVMAAVSYAEPQYGYDYYYPFQNYFRGGYPQPSFERASAISQPQEAQSPQQLFDPRTFFSTFTLTIGTTTTTSTSTVSTTCTTSTATLKACSPSGRRRRGMMVTGDKQVRGLFYNEQDQEHADGSIFLPIQKIEEPVLEKERVTRETQIPFMVQPGFQTPPEMGNGRWLVALGTSTVTSTTTSTYTATLTATCSSTTGFSSCSGSGK